MTLNGVHDNLQVVTGKVPYSSANHPTIGSLGPSLTAGLSRLSDTPAKREGLKRTTLRDDFGMPPSAAFRQLPIVFRLATQERSQTGNPEWFSKRCCTFNTQV